MIKRKQRSTIFSITMLIVIIVSSIMSYLLVNTDDTSIEESEASSQINTEIPPNLDGTFIVPLEIDYDSLLVHLQELKTLNTKIIIIMDIARKTEGGCTGTSFPLVEKRKIDAIMSFAESNGIKVYVGLASSWAACPEMYNSPNSSIVISHLRNYNSPDNPIMFILNNYGTNPSFAGWYTGDEPALGWWPQSTFDSAVGYWSQYVSAIKEKSTKPVLTAPSFCGAEGIMTPEQIANRALLFKQKTGIDIQLWQDCVNQFGIALRTNTPNSRYTTADYYQALSAKLGKDGLWAILEIGNCCMHPMQGGAYEATMLSRFIQQLKSAPTNLVAKRLTWAAQFQMSKTNPGRYQGADRLFSGTVNYLINSSSINSLYDISYTWATQPSSQYPDSGKELVNGIVGESETSNNLNSYLDSAYVGQVGTMIFEFDLKESMKIDYIGIHTLNYNSASILFPRSLKIECKESINGMWRHIKTYPINKSRLDSELVIGTPNGEKLSANCRYVKFYIENEPSAWTFISEVEIFGTPISNPTNTVNSTPAPTPVKTPTPTISVSPMPDMQFDADFDESGLVDIKDFVLFVKYYQQKDLKGDLNTDQKVDILDFQIFRGEYIKSS